jgi:hypothetical protein
MHTLSMKESGGDVVVVLSTQPGCAASFTLTVQANDSAEGITITPIPSLGEGMAVTAFEGVWHPDDAGRQGGPLDNPRLEFKTTDKTHLYAYVTTAMGGGDDGEEAFAMMERRGGRLGPVAVRLCLYHHKKKKTVRPSCVTHDTHGTHKTHTTHTHTTHTLNANENECSCRAVRSRTICCGC